uniref:Uncharacterized protein n=1 Tax=Helianthus annuus TaxID=4232 RepID=A0A251VMR7_HELAN
MCEFLIANSKLNMVHSSWEADTMLLNAGPTVAVLSTNSVSILTFILPKRRLNHSHIIR